MLEKTLLERLSNEPMISNEQTITISCAQDLEHYLPELTLKFTIGIDKEGKHFVSTGITTINERRETLDKNNLYSLKEYDLGNGVFIYYKTHENAPDEIVSIVVQEYIEDPNQDAEQSNKELVKFLELAEDADAMQAYRSLAFYWTALQTGISFNLGHMTVEYEEDEEDEENENYGDNYEA